MKRQRKTWFSFSSFFIFFFSLFIILFPTQLGYHFWPDWAYIWGLKIDYLAPTLYLTDILFLAVFGLWLKEKLKGKRFLFKQLDKFKLVKFKSDKLKFKKVSLRGFWLTIGIFSFLFIGCFLSQNRGAAFYKLAKIVELFFLGFLVARSRIIAGFKYQALLVLAMVYSGLMALVQFIKQASLDGFFWWLGERTFSLNTPGIAKTAVKGRLFLRPYATFSHPNALAGFLLVSLILIGPYLFKFFKENRLLNKVLVVGFALLIVLTIALSFSRSAWLVAGLAAFFFLIKKIFIGKVFIKKIKRKTRFLRLAGVLGKQRAQEAVWQRLILNQIGLQLIKERPFFGVGLNNFIVSLPYLWPPEETVRLLQPVHNLFLLIGAETGLVGLLIFLWFLFLTFKKLLAGGFESNWSLIMALGAILALGFFDHYWFTLQQNQLLFSFVLGLSWQKQKKK